MATPNLDRLSLALSYKIFDPVGTALEDGKKFYAISRINYINRAYSDLILIIESLYYDKPKIFPKYYKLLEIGDLTSAPYEYTLPKDYEIISVFYTDQEDNNLRKADSIEPTTYLDAKYEVNAMNDPDTDNRKWTVIGGKLLFLPYNLSYYSVIALVRDSLGEFVQGGSEDIIIPKSLEPLLLEIAAREAMADDAQFDKVATYTKLIAERKELLAVQTATNKKKMTINGGA